MEGRLGRLSGKVCSANSATGRLHYLSWQITHGKKNNPERDDINEFSLFLYPKGTIFSFEMSIGEHIRKKRKTFGLTQIELAERSGVGVRFVRELENGKNTVRLDKVNQVLKLFGEELQAHKINE